MIETKEKYWDYTIESTGTGKTRMYDTTGKIINRTANNIKGKIIRVWNISQAQQIREKGGKPIHAWSGREIV